MQTLTLTSGTTNPSTNTTGGGTAASGGRQYGLHYSWCTAMNGQPEACQTAAASQTNQSVNGGTPTTLHNICPLGWRLPTGQATTGEYQLLANALGATDNADGSTNLRANGLFMLSGAFYNGSFFNVGGLGLYWSSTVNGTTNARILYFSGGFVNPANNGNKGNGHSVRCVLDIPPPPPLATGEDMQLIGTGARSCPLERTRAVDARDGNTYWVRKIADTKEGGGDLCWMETNLAYRGGGVNTYGDVINGMVLGSAANNNIGAGQACRGDNATMNDHKAKCYWEHANSNTTSGTTNPSTSTDGGASNPQHGLHYSWCTAMNGQAEACQTAATSQPNQSVNGGTPTTLHNICPSGWRLPTGVATTGEFALLNNAINSGSTASPSGLLTSSLFMYSGFFNNNIFNSFNSSGYYWSSTVGSAAIARSPSFNSSNVNPAGSNVKGAGHSIRCVSP